MSDVPLGVLFGALIVLIVLSAFFSGSETGMMALNRYRLRHLAKGQHKGAKRAAELLERPDRLIGVILFGNNFVNIVASMLAAFVAWRIMGEPGLVLAPFLLTVVILVFAEVAPKTLAALHPERVAFPAAIVLKPLLRISYPVVAAINWLANGVLRLFGVSPTDVDSQQLSAEELRTVVNEAGTLISHKYQSMLVSILDLEKVTVDDIMVPRNEISGIDIEDEMDDIVDLLVHSQHTRLPLYRGDIDNVLGVLHLRKVLQPLEHSDLDKDWLLENANEPYFVPLGTPLNTQLRNFQRQRQRIGLVVDEYGDVDGLVTLEDLLEEIVGEFTTDPADHSPDVHPQDDGTYLIDGAANVRELNRSMHWELPTDGPKTLNGLVLEYLESIPEPGTSLLIARYPVEIVQVSGNAVKTARIKPAMRRPPPAPVDEHA
ncbi:MAG: CNNM domain-containing protein [Gammaproteobacteria bacterium]|nr:MAG: CNNM domain-containing protein [Gammaproteobacteria bacterium]